jgi:hypothetical protein
MSPFVARNRHGGAVAACPLSRDQRTSLGHIPRSEFDPTETSSPDRIGPAINLKTAKAPGIDIPATPLGRAAAYSLNGLTAQPHDAVSGFTGRVN